MTSRKVGPHRKILHMYGRNRGRATTIGRTFTPKPPRGAPGSDEAVLYSGNILYDPGFELFVGNAVGSFLKVDWEAEIGSTTFVLPRFDINSPTGQRWPDGTYVEHDDIAQWAQYTEPYALGDNNREGSHWQVIRREASDLDFTTIRGPNLGKWMARWYDWTSSGNEPFGNSVPGGLVIQGPGMPAGYSGRTEAGALISWSYYAWVDQGTGAEMDLCLQFYTQDGTPIFVVTNSHTLDTTKTEYSLTSNSPGGSYFMRACSSFRGVGGRGMMLQVDTGTLSVE